MAVGIEAEMSQWLERPVKINTLEEKSPHSKAFLLSKTSLNTDVWVGLVK